jgi:hypothetical protein
LARILAWLHEKFTRNFSVGKDLWSLPKTRSNGLIFGRFGAQSAFFITKEQSKKPILTCIRRTVFGAEASSSPG